MEVQTDSSHENMIKERFCLSAAETTDMNSNTTTVKFSELGLSSSILNAVGDKGYETPSPIQAEAIPAVLAGRDVMAAAQTGTGKTAGFTLPILELLSGEKPVRDKNIRALIVTPTRELAAQIQESVETYGKYLPQRSTVVFGGVKINPQIAKLRGGVDILVATPGRLLDLHGQGVVSFRNLEILVLDEADRMLDMGFIHDIKRILRLLPSKRQNLLFSATFSEEIRNLAKGLIHNPVEISVTPRNSTVDSVTQIIHPVDKKQKSALLVHLIKEHNWYQALVFCRTKHGSNRLAQFLEKRKISSAAIHGNKSQGARTRALAGFKNGDIRVLVATDIAARGLDIHLLPHVVNFDLPNVPEDYVHRIGRTGRAGASGEAVSLVCADESKQLNDIERLIRRSIERRVIPDFEPVHALPESRSFRKKSVHPGRSGGSGKRGGGSDSDRGRGRGKKHAGPSGNRSHRDQSRRKGTGDSPEKTGVAANEERRSANHTVERKSGRNVHEHHGERTSGNHFRGRRNKNKKTADASPEVKSRRRRSVRFSGSE